jgi:alpha-N-arabinofuranosidase
MDVFDLNANHTFPTVLRAFVETPSFDFENSAGKGAVAPCIDAVATRDDESGQLSVVLASLHESEPVPCRIRLLGGEASCGAKAYVLGADSPNAFNGIENPERARTQEIEVKISNSAEVEYRGPPHSVSVLKLGA